MPHRDPDHVSMLRYRRRVDRYSEHARVMTDDHMRGRVEKYENDIRSGWFGWLQLGLEYAGLLHPPADVKAFRRELHERSYKKHHTE